MDHFRYADGRLWCEDVNLDRLAARVGTPLYVYSSSTLRDHASRTASAFAPLDPLVCFAVKALPNVNVLRLLGSLGLGMDVVSAGELRRARDAGVPPERIVFAGVAKSEHEIRAALGGEGGGDPAAGPIAMFNVESEQELEHIAGIARAMGRPARAALRLNPDVDPGTHHHTNTGSASTKFGVPAPHIKTLFARFARDRFLKLDGLHLHIGSGVPDARPYLNALHAALLLMDELGAAGTPVRVLDFGGGFAADYKTGQAPLAADYAKDIVPLLAPRTRAGSLRVIIEPGRSISANAGVLLTRVRYVKQSGQKKFVICDAGMQTLVRPAMYGAFHFIWPVHAGPSHVPPRRDPEPDLPGLERCDVVGPICETADSLAKDRPLPPVAPGDLLAVYAAGAYGMSMASRYNSHPLPAEVLIDGADATLIRRAESYDDLVHHERDPRPVDF